MVDWRVSLSRRSPRRWMAPLVLSLCSTAAVLLVVEATLRIVHYAPPAPLAAWRAVNPAHDIALDCYPSNPRGYFDIDLRDRVTRTRYERLGVQSLEVIAVRNPYAVEYRYNSLGFRDREFAPRRPCVRRLIVLGDSFTEGQGVRREDAYPSVLDRLLNAARPGSWEVWNAGRRGADFPYLLDVVTRVIEQRPDVIVYGMVLNDAVRSRSFDVQQEYINDWIVDRRWFRPRPRSALRLLDLIRDAIDNYSITRQTINWYRGLYGRPNREGWNETKRCLLRMHRRCKDRNIAFVLALWPILANVDSAYPFSEATETVLRFCRLAKIDAYDLRAALRRQPTHSLWVHAQDMHPNEKAHALVAQYLLTHIEKK
jgi:lysophospholipase L1-like esterase